jgi:hypothetical protein
MKFVKAIRFLLFALQTGGDHSAGTSRLTRRDAPRADMPPWKK